MPKDVGRLHVLFRRENPTTLKQDFELLPQRTGKGRFIGSIIGIRIARRAVVGRGRDQGVYGRRQGISDDLRHGQRGLRGAFVGHAADAVFLQRMQPEPKRLCFDVSLASARPDLLAEGRAGSPSSKSATTRDCSSGRTTGRAPRSGMSRCPARRCRLFRGRKHGPPTCGWSRLNKRGVRARKHRNMMETILHEAASMGPRSIERGNWHFDGDNGLGGRASMGPRSIERGNSSFVTSTKASGQHLRCDR